MALELLVAMRATQAVPRLRELAQQDARIVAAIEDGVVRRGEWLQARLTQTIERLVA